MVGAVMPGSSDKLAHQRCNLFLQLIGFVLVLALPTVVLAAGNPNFNILFADYQGWGDLGVYGHPDIRTPHTDRMAAEGMRFTSFTRRCFVDHRVLP